MNLGTAWKRLIDMRLSFWLALETFLTATA